MAEPTAPQSGMDITLPETKTMDLQPQKLAEKIAVGREIALSGKAPGTTEVSVSLPEIIERHSQELGLSADQYQQAATQQGLDVQRMVDEVGRKGRDVLNYLEELETADVTATQPFEQRKLKARGEEIAKLGKERLETRQARRTKDATSVEEIEEAVRDLKPPTQIKLSDKKAAFFGPEDPKDDPEVVEYGQDGSQHAFAIKRKYEKDEGLRNAVDVFNQMFVSSAGQNFVDWNTERALKTKGIDTTSEKFEDAYRKEYKKSMEDLAGLYIAGLWTAPTFVRGWDTGVEGKDLTFSEAVQPNVEIIGFNAQGNVIARQESNLMWGLSMLDLPQSALSGAVFGDGALEGIAKRKLFLDDALQSDFANQNMAAKVAAGTAGLAATVLFPDLTVLFGGTAKIARELVRSGAKVRDAKRAIPLVEQSVEMMVKGMNGDPAAAQKAADLHSQIRKYYPQIADQLDQLEVDVVGRYHQMNPDIIDPKLSKIIPDDAGVEMKALHTSKAKGEFRKGEDAGAPIFGSYAEFYNYNDALDSLAKVKVRVINDDPMVYRRFVKDATDSEISKVKITLGNALGDFSDGVRNKLDDLDLLTTNPSQWALNLRNQIARDVPRSAMKDADIAKKIDAVFNGIDVIRDASKRAKAEAPTKDVMLDAIIRAEEAVKLNMEARANASNLLREALHGLVGNDQPPPLNIAVGQRPLRDVSEVAEFSIPGIRLMDDLMRTMGMTKDEAMGVVRVTEGMARAAKRSYGTVVEDWYSDNLTRRMQDMDDFVAEFGPRQGVATQTDWQVQPLANGTFQLTSKQIRENAGKTDLLEGLTFRITPKRLKIESVELPENLRGKGIGFETYMEVLAEAQRRNLDFFSDINPSADAINVYERLIKAGVPIKKGKANKGKDVQYRISAKALQKADLNQSLSDGLLTAPGTVHPGAVSKFTDEGKLLIFGLGQPDIRSVYRELGRVALKNLSVRDQKKIVEFLNDTQGIPVRIEGGQLVGDAGVVQRAETAFVDAFADYISAGKLPSTEAKSAFESIKDFMIEAYQAVTRTKTPMTLADEVEDVFADIAAKAPPREPIMKRTLKMLDEQLLGRQDRSSMLTRGTNEVVRRMRREGLKTISGEELTAAAQAAITAKEPGRALITFDKPMFADELGVPGGVQELNAQDLAKLSLAFDEQRKVNAAMGQGNLARVVREQKMEGLTPAERLDEALIGDDARNKVGRFVKGTLMGGNAMDDLKGLSPEMRRRVMGAERTVANGTHEAIRLISEAALNKDDAKYWDKIYKYLSGENVAFEQGGRRVVSSGTNTTNEVLTNFRRSLQEGMFADKLDVLKRWAEAVQDVSTPQNVRQAFTNLSKADQAAISEVLDTLWKSEVGSLYVRDLLVAMVPEVAGDRATLIPTVLGPLTETLMYHGGLVARNGKMIDTLTDEQVARSFLGDLSKTFGKEAEGRAAILTATHGLASQARKDMASAGLALDGELANLWTKWINGEFVPPDKMPKLRQFADKVGFGIPVEAQILDSDIMIPLAARQRLANAIARGTDPEQLRKAGGYPGADTEMEELRNTLLRLMKIRMTRGATMVRQRYFLMNSIDHFQQMAVESGLAPAIASEIRLAAQNAMAAPGVARTIDAYARLANDPGRAEKVRDALQRGGDAAAKKVSDWLNLSKYHINVNPVLDGRDEIIQVGDTFYNARDLRKIMVEEGVFSSFDVSELTSAVRQLGEQILLDARNSGKFSKDGLAKMQEWFTFAVSDMAEAWGERKRIGAAISLMEQGMDPRAAARLSVKALFDYGGTMSKADRHWLLSMVLPFWAFQKNANRMVFNNLFSPMGAYRMSVLRRTPQAAGDLVTELLYDSVADPYGVDSSAMPPELKDQYFSARKVIEEQFGGKPSYIPEEVKLQMRAWLRGHNAWLDGKTLKFIDADIVDMLTQAGLPREELSQYTVRKRPKSARPQWLRDRAGIAIPQAVTDANKDLIAASTNVTGEYPYLEVFMQDSTFNSGFRHMGGTLAAYGQMAELLTGAVPSDSDIDFNIQFLNNLRDSIADPERAPILGDTLRAMSGKDAMPVRVHPAIAELYEMTFPGAQLIRVPALKDPLGGPPTEDEKTLKQERIYIMGGIPSVLFRQAPGLAEVNQLFLKQMSPTGTGVLTDMEKRTALGMLAGATRIATGAQVEEFSRERTAKQATPRKTDDRPALGRSR